MQALRYDAKTDDELRQQGRMAAQLDRAGQPAEAETVYRPLLARWPDMPGT